MAARSPGEGRASSSETRTAFRVTTIVVGVAAVAWLLYALRTVILLLVFSVLFAYLVAPLVKLARRTLVVRRHHRLPAPVGIAIVYLGIFGALSGASSWLVPRVTEQAAEFGKAAPSYVQSLNAGSRAFSRIFRRLQAPELGKTIIERITAAADSIGQQAVSSVVHAASYLPWLVLIPILAFFLLKDGEQIRRGALALLPDRWRTHASEFVERVDRSLAAFIRAQLLASLIVGILSGVGLALLGVPYAATLGVAAGICEFVPLLGPFVLAVVAASIAGMNRPMLAVWVIVYLGVLRVVEDYVIYPRLVGHNIHLHPLAVILAVLAGAELGGVVGVLLAVPALAVASAAYDSFGEGDS